MILKKSLFLMSLAAVFATATTVSANDEVSRGAILSASCFACHGTDGKSKGSIPSIDKKSALQIEQALTNFKLGASTIMGRHAKGYSGSDIKLIAKYISGGNK